jgi:hypothetical protein
MDCETAVVWEGTEKDITLFFGNKRQLSWLIFRLIYLFMFGSNSINGKHFVRITSNCIIRSSESAGKS